MEKYRRLWLATASGFLVVCGASALTQNPYPYSEIPVRNVFHLLSPEVSVPTNPPVQIPKLFLQGITRIGDQWQVLFRSQMASAGQTVLDKSYMVRPGQGEDGIQVRAIDPAVGEVQFDNHGVVQILNLENVGVHSGMEAGPAPVAQVIPKMAPPAQSPVENASPLTSEQQTVMIEVERERTKQQVEDGDLPPLPATELTSEAQ